MVKKEIISIDKFGIGEETHKGSNESLIGMSYESEKKTIHPLYREIKLKPVEETRFDKIMDAIENIDTTKQEKKPDELKPPRYKLYLNNSFKLLNINNIFSHYRNEYKKYVSRIKIWWSTNTTNDMKDLVKFVFIHGILVGSTLLCLLTMTSAGSEISLVERIKDSVLLTMIMYLIGGGSLYYLFLDINKSLSETWRRRRK